MRGVEASLTARLWASAVDAVVMGSVGLLVLVVGTLASTPFWHVNGGGEAPGGSAGSLLLDLDRAMPSWVVWAIVGAVLLAGVALSGALSDRTRASLGLVFAEARLVDADLARDADPDLPALALGPAPEPARWRVALRWLVPLLLLLVAGRVGGLAVTLALLGLLWAPVLLPGRRSGYDRLAGLTVVRAAWATRQPPVPRERRS